jgi:hypothetical protein
MILDEKRKTGTKGLGTKGLAGCPEVRSFSKFPARFLDHAEAKMVALKIAPKKGCFGVKLAKNGCFLAKKRRFFGVPVY